MLTNALQNITDVIIRMLRLLSQPNRHIKSEKLTPGWLGTFYYCENVIGYTRAGVDRKIPYKQLYNKIRNLVQRKIQVAKNRTSNHITKRLNSLCQSNPNFWKIVNQYWQPSTDRSFSLLYNRIALRSHYDESNIFNNFFAFVSTLPNVDLSFPPFAPKADSRIPQYTSNC